MPRIELGLYEKCPTLLDPYTVGVAGIEPTLYQKYPILLDLNIVGMPRIELGLYPPHGYVLPVYYTPSMFMSPTWIYTTTIRYPDSVRVPGMDTYYRYTTPRFIYSRERACKYSKYVNDSQVRISQYEARQYALLNQNQVLRAL